MHGFLRRPIALFACALFSGLPLAHADEGLRMALPATVAPDDGKAAAVPVVSGDESEAARLRVERRFGLSAKNRRPTAAPPAVLATDDSLPLFLVADRITGQTEVHTEAEGNVELRKAGQLILADQATYRPLDDELEATGNVRLLQDGAEVRTPHLRMKLSDQLGFADQASYFIVREVASRFYEATTTVVTVASVNGANSGAPMMLNVPNSYGLPTTQPEKRLSSASGEAERIDFLGENLMHLTGATFSTCKPATPDWYLKTAEMNLDYDNNEGDAKHASLWFKGVPLFYSPVAWFPLNQQRRSGVLSPSFSQSTRNGLDLTLPYYWNIAPNYDATLYPRYLGKRGMQLGVEGRYLGEQVQGDTRIEYMPDDRLAERRRYAYGIRHQQGFGSGWSGLVNWNGVSDDHYWEDMSSRLMQTSQTQLPRQAALNYAPSSWLQTSLQVLRYQTLQPDPANPVERPYFLEPQLNVVAYKPNVWKTDFSMIGQYSRFTHPTKVDGERVVFYPQFSLPIVHPAFQITPKIGLHATYYSLGDPVGNNVSTISRTLPILSLDSTVTFEREGEWLGNSYIQTLEPRLYYVNIPYRDQSNIPVFDSGLSDFNFAQIFSENRYSGYDRINDASQLTAAVTSRFLDGESGVELFKATLGQRYYFKPQRVSITGETVRQDDFSNLVAAVNGLVAPKTYAEAAWEYNYKDSVNQRFSAGVRFQPDYGKVLSASYRYTRDPLTRLATVDQVDLAGQWPLAPRWYAVGRYNYSLRDSQLLEAIGGLEYNAGCWAVRGVVQRLGAISGTPNDTFFLQLELTDFASLGSNPLGLLRRSIPGYGKTNELPADHSLLNQP